MSFQYAWNSADHMVPCMALHGSLMNQDPGICEKLRKQKKVTFRPFESGFIPKIVETFYALFGTMNN